MGSKSVAARLFHKPICPLVYSMTINNNECNIKARLIRDEGEERECQFEYTREGRGQKAIL